VNGLVKDIDQQSEDSHYGLVDGRSPELDPSRGGRGREYGGGGRSGEKPSLI